MDSKNTALIIMANGAFAMLAPWMALPQNRQAIAATLLVCIKSLAAMRLLVGILI